MSQCVYLVILPLAKCCVYRDVASAGFYCFIYLFYDCIWVILCYKRECRSAGKSKSALWTWKFSFSSSFYLVNSTVLHTLVFFFYLWVWFCCSWKMKSVTVSSCPWVAVIPQRFPRWQWPCPALSSADIWMRAVRNLSDRSVFPIGNRTAGVPKQSRCSWNLRVAAVGTYRNEVVVSTFSVMSDTRTVPWLTFF